MSRNNPASHGPRRVTSPGCVAGTRATSEKASSRESAFGCGEGDPRARRLAGVHELAAVPAADMNGGGDTMVADGRGRRHGRVVFVETVVYMATASPTEVVTVRWGWLTPRVAAGPVGPPWGIVLPPWHDLEQLKLRIVSVLDLVGSAGEVARTLSHE